MSRIYRVDQAHVVALRSVPPSISISAVGAVSSSGWTSPSFSPWIYITPPADGIYDFDFDAVPPTGPSLSVITPIAHSQIFQNPPADLKGVRIHATSNSREALLNGRDDKNSTFDFTVKHYLPWPRVDSREA